MMMKSLQFLLSIFIATLTSYTQAQSTQCPPNYTGYKATSDCRGYIYCNSGVISGGIIPCQPNMLFDVNHNTCTNWQNVNYESKCPSFDGKLMLPELVDENANPNKFYCGFSSSNARSVCEPCPGGSRLECSNVNHQCYAGITGCDSNSGSSSSSNNNVNNINPPPPSPPAVIAQYNAPSPPTNQLVSVELAPKVNNNNNNAAEQVGGSSSGVMQHTYYCGIDWKWVTGNCAIAIPCPSGVAAGTCPAGHKCIANTPCHAHGKLPTPNPTRFPTNHPTNPPITTDDPTKRYCGYNWKHVSDTCLSATPCPLGFAQGVCPSGMTCIAETPCSDSSYLDMLKEKEKNQSSSTNGSTGVISSPINVPVSSPQVTTNNNNNKPTTPTSFISSPTINNNNNGGSYTNPQGNKYFCGTNYNEVTSQCLKSKPCPSGKGFEHCKDHEGCYAAPSCTSEYEQQQQQSSSSSSVSNNNAAVVVHPPSSSTSVSNTSPINSLCSSHGDCPTGKFCNQPNPNEVGTCGSCLISNGLGCATEDVCRTTGCHSNQSGSGGVAKCYKRSELDSDCEIRLNDIGARCNVNTMKCESTKQTTNTPAVSTTVQQQVAQQQQAPPKQTVSQPAQPEDMASNIPSTLYRNPTDNTYFCGVGYYDITAQCLQARPCPGGKSAGYCQSHEACFGAPSCTKEYEQAGLVGGSSSNNNNVVVQQPPPASQGNDVIIPPQYQTQPEVTNDPPPPAKEEEAPAVSKPIVSETTTSSKQTDTLVITSNFCGVSWDEHIKDCSKPCPLGDECSSGETCFHGSPCSTTQSVVTAAAEDDKNDDNDSGSTSNSIDTGSSTSTAGNKSPAEDFMASIVTSDDTNNNESATISSSAESILDSLMVDDESSSTAGNSLPAGESSTPVDKEEGEGYHESGPGKIQTTEEESTVGSSSSVAGCNLCEEGIESWHHMNKNGRVDFNGDTISCTELTNKLSSQFEPGSDKCIETKVKHFDDCCYEKCNLCGDSSLDNDATVLFSGEEVRCGDLQTTILVDEGVSADSSRCTMSQGFYADDCCIKAVEQPCNLCSRNGVNFIMRDEWEVTYKGEESTCLEVYSQLLVEHEDTSDDCSDIRGELFDQCCEAKLLGGGKSDDTADEQTREEPLTNDDYVGFDTWYKDGLTSTASLTKAVSIGLMLISYVMEMIALC